MANQENVYTCDKCGATFRDADALVKHQQIHSGDVNEKKEAERIFVEEFESLSSAGFLDVQMAVKPTKDVKLKRIRQAFEAHPID